MSALYAWLRRHPMLVDTSLALIVLLFGLPELMRLTISGWCAVAALTTPVAFRRRYPVATFTVAAATAALQVITGMGPTGSDVSLVVLLYTLAAYQPRRRSVVGLGLVLLGCLSVTVTWILDQATTDEVPASSRLFVGLLFFGGPSVLAWAIGDSMRVRRAYYIDLEDRAARLERERDARAQIAAAAERARIARELHDVVAHNVSVMVVQADGAAYALESSPDRTREALATISVTGRQALTEMRRLLGVLRDGSDEDGYAPQPGVEQLDDLLSQVRDAGLPVTLAVEGVPAPLSAGVALTVYRIVQESLTNTRKHGGPLARSKVTFQYGDEALRLRVVDSGRGALAESDGAGHGLIGMRERLAMLGGTLSAGPRPTGGFEVVATLPYNGDAGDEPAAPRQRTRLVDRLGRQEEHAVLGTIPAHDGNGVA